MQCKCTINSSPVLGWGCKIMKILEKKTKFFLNTLKMKMKIYIILFPPKLSECNQSQCHAKHRLGAISKKKPLVQWGSYWSSGGPNGPVGILLVQWGSYWSSEPFKAFSFSLFSPTLVLTIIYNKVSHSAQ